MAHSNALCKADVQDRPTQVVYPNSPIPAKLFDNKNIYFLFIWHNLSTCPCDVFASADSSVSHVQIVIPVICVIISPARLLKKLINSNQ